MAAVPWPVKVRLPRAPGNFGFAAAGQPNLNNLPHPSRELHPVHRVPPPSLPNTPPLFGKFSIFDRSKNSGEFFIAGHFPSLPAWAGLGAPFAGRIGQATLPFSRGDDDDCWPPHSGPRQLASLGKTGSCSAAPFLPPPHSSGPTVSVRRPDRDQSPVHSSCSVQLAPAWSSLLLPPAQSLRRFSSITCLHSVKNGDFWPIFSSFLHPISNNPQPIETVLGVPRIPYSLYCARARPVSVSVSLLAGIIR